MGLSFGISSTPGLFQREMEKLFQGIENVVVFQDDILITGPTFEKHVDNLNKVLSKLEAAGLTVNKDKCKFFQKEIYYLGHVLNEAGLKMDERKIKAITNAKLPNDITQLKGWLGLIN